MIMIENSKPVIVFDIDGTLANCDHRIGLITVDSKQKKDWAKFHAGIPNDAPHEHMVWLARSCFGRANVIICTGRMEDSRVMTEDWLKKHKVPYDQIYMRISKDYRTDNIVKVELLNQIRKEWGEPYIWFDDRKRVVDAIRAEGVPVCQVSEGDF